jgi:hypothetical protein
MPAGDIEWGFSCLNLDPDMKNDNSLDEIGRVLIPAADRRMLERYCAIASI